MTNEARSPKDERAKTRLFIGGPLHKREIECHGNILRLDTFDSTTPGNFAPTYILCDLPFEGERVQVYVADSITMGEAWKFIRENPEVQVRLRLLRHWERPMALPRHAKTRKHLRRPFP